MMIILIIIEYTFGIFFDKLKMIMQTNLFILTGMETSACEVYIVFKTSASITLKYSKNDKLIVNKSQ